MPHPVDVGSLADGVEGYPISGLRGHWIQVAGVWDRKGIAAGTRDTVRLYVNGKIVVASKATDWARLRAHGVSRHARVARASSTLPGATTPARMPAHGVAS